MDGLLVFLKEEDGFCLFSRGEVQERRGGAAEDEVGLHHTLVNASVLHERSMELNRIYRHNNKRNPFKKLTPKPRRNKRHSYSIKLIIPKRLRKAS